jgi:uridine phosphorylase
MARVCPHLLVEPGDLAETVLLPGDPGRAARIAQRLGDVQKTAENREYHTYRGTFRGVSVSVISTGVGSPGASIAFEEAIRAGAKTLIRVGTAGSIHDDVRTGDLVVVLGAVRGEGTTRQLVPIEVPAVADPDVSRAIWDAAKEEESRVHRGIGVTLDAFYRGALDLGFDTYAEAGAICVEMECSALFVVGRMRGVRTGAIVAIDGDARCAAAGDHDPHLSVVCEAIDRGISAALEAVALLSGAVH